MTSPALAKSSTFGARTYVWPPSGEEFPSVTTILNSLPKHALKNWAAKLVAEFAWNNRTFLNEMPRDEAIDWLKREPLRTTNRAANLGTAIHHHIETGQVPDDITDEERSRLNAYETFLADWQPDFSHSEITVFNRTVGYAGTLDAVATLPAGNGRGNGGRYLIDWKTGKGVYPEAALQLAAYAHAEWWDLGDHTTQTAPLRVHGALVVHLTPDGYNIHAATIDNDTFRTFRHLCKIHQWLSNNRHAIRPIGHLNNTDETTGN